MKIRISFGIWRLLKVSIVMPRMPTGKPLAIGV
jgi:hypothetical protein